MLAVFRAFDISVPDAYALSDHAFDALIASLTARAAALGNTIAPAQSQQAAAQREGWIHLPIPDTDFHRCLFI